MPQLLTPAAKYLRDVLPDGLVELPGALDDVWMEPPAFETKPHLKMAAGFVVEQEIVLGVPGVDAVSIVIGKSADVTKFLFGFETEPSPAISLKDVPIALRFRSDLLAPARQRPGSGGGAPAWERDPTREHLEIALPSVTLAIDLDGNLTLDAGVSIDLPPCMIGDSGVVIEARDLAFHMDATDPPPPGQPAGWRGLRIGHAALHLPGELSATVGTLELTDACVGNGGFSGTVSDTWSPPRAASLFGLDFTLGRVEIEFVQNAPVACGFGGTVTLPFFDQPVGVDIEIGLDGSYGITLSATQPAGVSGTGGVITFSKPGILSVTVDSLGFTVEDGLFTATISGTVRPEIAGIDWPDFAVRELSIDSDGNVRLEGGWLDLPDQYSLDFHGFQLDITRLGFGRAGDGGRWVGFSGGIKLVDGLTAGASVDGLRITWYDSAPVRVSLDGVAVELEIPGTLRFAGEVSYRELPGPVHRFDGAIELDLLALDLQIDGKIVVGTAPDGSGGTTTFFAIYVGVELPAGIPLFSTGLALYGVAGLVAIDMAPNKGKPPHQSEEWYENPDGSAGWYKRPDTGVTDLATKWDPEPGGFAVGGGVTLGTVADNGFTFNGKLLLVISLPGPVILIEGKANLLAERASLDDDPTFRALAVLDFGQGTFLVGLDAAYQVGGGGELIEIGGGAEFFFSLADALAWHLYLGHKDPRERRIRARFLSLFESNAYFMISAKELATGAWVGYDAHWKFGPLSVDVEAWIDGGVLLSFKPVYFHGEIWLHGKVALRVFGFGLGLHVDARFAVDVFDPFHVLAEFSVGISLPWPLPDFDVDITLEWGPSPKRPPLPVPLKEIAVEHFKATASWPLPRGSLMLPDRDDGAGFLVLPPAAADDTAPAPAQAPVVPLDARPHVTFGRPVHDDALVGVNPQPVLPAANPPGYERVGDPAAGQGPMRIRNALREVALYRRAGASWALVARKGTTSNPAGVRTLYGSWAPIPALPAGQVAPGTDPPISQVKLWLWSRTPFEYTAHGGSAWDEWFTDAYADYPCVHAPGPRTVCCDVDRRVPGIAALPIRCPDGIVIGGARRGQAAPAATVTVLAEPADGHTQALCWTAGLDAPLPIAVEGAPASRAELLVVTGSAPATSCLTPGDLRPGEEVELPWRQDGFTLVLAGADGGPLDTGPILDMAGIVGLHIAQRAEIDLPYLTDVVEVTLASFGAEVTVSGIDARGERVAAATVAGTGTEETVLLGGPDLVTVVIEAPEDETLLLALCARGQAGRAEVWAVGVDDDGAEHGPFHPTGQSGGIIAVEADRLRRVEVYGTGSVCLVRVCFTVPADPTQVLLYEEMAEHLAAASARFADEGAVLDPGTTYRLSVTTRVEAVGEGDLAGVNETHDLVEHAYFRTEGPPALAALSTPVNHPADEPFDSGLTDLTRYVDHTVPASGTGGHVPTRPVYRAYDVGAVFDEDYVDLMYRLARRDLTVQLYDANNRPVRGPEGGVIVLGNRWGHVADVILTDSERRYVTVTDGVECVTLDEQVVPRNRTLFAAHDGQVLAPDAVHEARLVPLLFHDDFTTGLAGWTVVDQGTEQAPSAWATTGHEAIEGTGATAAGDVVTLTGAGSLSAVEAGRDLLVLATDTARAGKTYLVLDVDTVAKTVQVDGNPVLSGGKSDWRLPAWGRLHQTSNIWGGSDDPVDPVMPGTMLVTGSASWTDYRLSVLVRPEDDDPVGIVFRYQGPGTYYRFSLDRQRGYRRLVRVVGGVHTLLGEDEVRHPAGSDLLLTAEVTSTATGADISVYVDERRVFAVSDAGIGSGKIGLYCWANQDCRWSDVRVDDLSAAAPVAYRFAFTTSGYGDFFHQLHSADAEPAVVDVAGTAAATVGTALAAAVPPGTAPGEAEHRAYAAFAEAALGPAARTAPPRPTATAVRAGGAPVALCLRGPEPIDWARTSLVVARAAAVAPPVQPARPAGALALTGVATGGSTPNDEILTLLAGEGGGLAGHVVERRRPAGPIAAHGEEPLATGGPGVDDRTGSPRGTLLVQEFGPAALSRYEIVDEPGTIGASAWSVAGGAITQTSNMFGGSDLDPAKPGTIALTAVDHGDVAITATLRSTDNDAIGLVFRYAGPQDYYRFSMDAQRSYRRLVKRVGGTVTTLWEDTTAGYTVGQAYQVEIRAYGEVIVGHLDGVPLFAVRDTDLAGGRVGLYCWLNIGARFEALRVETLDRGPLLWAPEFADLGEVEIVDETADAAPSAWSAGPVGTLAQTSPIGSPADPERAGTAALSRPWSIDRRMSVRLTADTGAIGVYICHTGPDDWLRFAFDTATGTRRLVTREAGTVSVLWQMPGAYTPGEVLDLTVEVAAPRLRILLGGIAMFDGVLSRPLDGRFGLYAAGCPTAAFSRVVVTDLTRTAGPWTAVDLPGSGVPSAWRTGGAMLRQLAPVGIAGTVALAGGAAAAGWTDYRVRVRALAFAGTVGVAARWRGARDHYRLELTASAARLVRVAGGATSVLWQDGTLGYPVGTPVTLTLDCVGDRLAGYLGEVELFSLTDPAPGAPAAGAAGPYSAGTGDVTFTRIAVTRPPLAAYALYRDSFADADISEWTVIDQSTVSGPAAWSVTGGELVQTSNAHTLPEGAAVPGTHAVAGDATWTDVLLAVRLRSDDDDAIGVLFRYTGPGDYYRFSMDAQRSYRRLVACVGGAFTVLWEDTTAGYDVGRWYEVVISAAGGRLRGWIDGVPVFSVADVSHPAGRVGVYCWADQGARFSRVAVYPPAVAPRGFTLAADLDGLGMQAWELGAEGDVGGPAVWRVSGGELVQSADVSDSGPPGDPALLGALALAPAEPLADFRLTVSLASDTDAAIGVVFRHVDAGTWYRFSMDRAAGYRRLVRCAAGTATVLWSDAVGYEVGRRYLFTVDAIGAELTGHLDGVRLFTVTDGAIASGRVGLYCRHNTAARFARIELAEPEWEPLYRFDAAEPALPAATRVRVHSGNAADWTGDPVAGLVERFAARLGDPGEPRLPADRAVVLRVRDPRGAVVHARTFLPAAAFTPLAGARVLRRADGTELALTAASPAALPAGTYRLTFTYRRDNTAADPGSDVLSRAGDSSDEVVVLDLPWPG